MAFRSYAEHQHQNGPGGGTEAVNLPKGGLLPRLGGVLFWGAENLSLMTLIAFRCSSELIWHSNLHAKMAPACVAPEPLGLPQSGSE